MSTLERAHGSGWPAPWHGHADPHWPQLHTAPPCRPGAGETMCLRLGGTEVVVWADAAEAREAARLLFDRACGAGCAGRHSVIWTDQRGATHVGPCAEPPPPPLADELERLYPRRRHGLL